MQTLELRTTTSKGFTFHDIQPFVRPPEGPGGTCRLSRSFWLRIGWVACPSFSKNSHDIDLPVRNGAHPMEQEVACAREIPHAKADDRLFRCRRRPPECG